MKINKEWKTIGLILFAVLAVVLTASMALADNAVPIINAIAEQKATQDQEFSLVVTATDTDNPQTDLLISEADSTLGWLKVKDKMTLYGTPIISDIDKREITVVVSDGLGNSLPVTFNLTKIPGLEIKKDDSLEIYVNTVKKYNYSDVTGGKLEAAQGDVITVKFKYGNNFATKVLGYIKLSANSLGVDYVKYSKDVWNLLPGKTESAEFTFTVPLEYTGSTFTVSIDAEDEDEIGEVYEDHIDNPPLQFKMNYKVQSGYIKAVSVDDDNLTCNTIATLQIKLINNGNNSLTPELSVFNQPASIDGQTGMVTSSGATLKHYPDDVKNEVKLVPGEEKTISIPVNVSMLSGAQKLYVYLVSPWFYDKTSNSYYFGDKEEAIEIKNVGACLKKDVIEKKLSLAKNSDLVKINLIEKDANGNYVYINEDDDASGIVFEVPTGKQSNSALINCHIDQQMLVCDKPTADKDGSSEVTLKISKDASVIEENVMVKVSPGLKFTIVEINGKSKDDVLKNGLTISPLEKIVVKYKLRNDLEEKVVKGTVQFVDPDGMNDGKNFVFNDNKPEGFNLNTKTETAVKTFMITMPADVTEALYNLAFVAEAKTASTYSTQKDTFAFTVNVVQTPELNVAATGKEDKIVCTDQAMLDVVVTNTGKADKDDVVIKVMEGDTAVYTSPKVVLAKNGGAGLFTVPLTVSTSGKHTYSVKAEYDYDISDVAGTVVAKSVEVTKEGCLDIASATPPEKSKIIGEASSVNFEVKVLKAGFENSVQWLVNDVQVASGLKYTFTSVPANIGKEFKIKAKLSSEETDVWTISVTNKPVSKLLTTNILDGVTLGQLKVFKDFTVSNTYGKIVYSMLVDLSKVYDLDKAITISEGKVSVDTTLYPELNKPATVTLYKKFNAPFFFSGGVICTGCTVLTSTSDKLEFTVSGFSMIEVKEDSPAGVEVSEILFDNALDSNVELGKTVTKTFTIKNTGTTKDLTGISIDTSVVNSKYKVTVSGMQSTLAANQQQTVTLGMTIPTDESSGKHSIGTIKVNSNEAPSKTADVYLSTKSYLAIDEVKINGKSSGKLKINDNNEVKVYVLNNYNYDVEDITVNVKMTVDDTDLEEESEAFDADKGDTQDATVEIDLTGENIDEEMYTLEITVEGKGTDGAKQKTTQKYTYDVDREKHKVQIKDVILSPNDLQCGREASLKVNVENIGKSDEDRVQIKVSNTALGIDQTKEYIKLDKFSDSDNEFKTFFPLNLEEATAGSYIVQVDVLRDGIVDDTKTISLSLKDCGSLTTSTVSKMQSILATDETSDLLKAQLQQNVQTKQSTDSVQRVVKGSFRESDTYTLMLGVLALLVFIALVLALLVLTVRRKR